jgi:hypothetical protein
MNNGAHPNPGVAGAFGSVGEDSYGTPPWLVEAARELMGGSIDLDVCSNEEYNQTVRATKFFTAAQDALQNIDGEPLNWNAETAFCNPPGGKARLGQQFWARLYSEWQTQAIKQAFFVAFSIDYLSTTQWKHSKWGHGGMLDFPCFVFGRRFGYVVNGKIATSPPRPSVVCWLPPRTGTPASRATRFQDWALRLPIPGKVSLGHHT